MSPFRLLAILDSAFAGFPAGVAHRDAGNSVGTCPSPWLLELS